MLASAGTTRVVAIVSMGTRSALPRARRLASDGSAGGSSRRPSLTPPTAAGGSADDAASARRAAPRSLRGARRGLGAVGPAQPVRERHGRPVAEPEDDEARVPFTGLFEAGDGFVPRDTPGTSVVAVEGHRARRVRQDDDPRSD